MPPRSPAFTLLSFAPLAIFGIFCTGCELFDSFFDDSVTLADFAPARAKVSVELAEFSRAQIAIEAKDGSCPTIREDVEARVNDKPMDMFMRGGQKPTSSKEWICGSPTFRRNVSESDLGGASTRFDVGDETGDLTVEATGLLLARTITPTVKDVPIEAGVETSFEWSVATDEIDETLLDIDFVYDDETLSLSGDVSKRIEGSFLFVKLPANSPAGTGKLQLDVTAKVPVKTCTGVPACEASVHALAEVAIDVAVSPVP